MRERALLAGGRLRRRARCPSAAPKCGWTCGRPPDDPKILLADDHAVVRRGLRMVLEAQPDLTVVAEAGDGIEAVEHGAARTRSTSRCSTSRCRRQQLAQHERQDAAVLVVLDLLRRVDAHARRELLVVRRCTRDLLGLAALDAGDRELLLAGQPERLGVLAVGELQRQHAHADQVGAVDALEGLGDHRPHAEQLRALGRPVARRAGAVLLAGEHDQRRALLGVLASPRRRSSSPRRPGMMPRHAALGARRELVAQADVGERAAHHHLVVAAARAVGVEVLAARRRAR